DHERGSAREPAARTGAVARAGGSGRGGSGRGGSGRRGAGAGGERRGPTLEAFKGPPEGTVAPGFHGASAGSGGSLSSTSMVSIREVANHAGVSVGTVSNVLNRPEIVAPATRSRVLEAIAALGFVPNESARQLRRGRSRALGLVVLDVANPFFTDVARGVDDATGGAGMAVIFCNSDGDPAREAAYLDLLEEQRVQGVLIAPIDDANERLLRPRERGILVVLLDRLARRADLCSVSVDDRLGGELAIRHLLEAGHRRIAFVGGPWRLEQVRDRFHGAQQAVREAGLGE